MNEYAITLDIRWWAFPFPGHAVDTFAVSANDATHALKLARGGFVTGMESYGRRSYDPYREDLRVDLSHLTIRVLSIKKL